MVFAINIITYNQIIIGNAKCIKKVLEYLVYFCWNMSPTGASPNLSFVNLCLPIWHAKVVRYEDCFCLVSGYSISNWHLLVWGTLYLYVLGIYHWWLGLCTNGWLVPDWVMWSMVPLVLELLWNCCNFQLLSSLLGRWLFAVFAAALWLFWMALVNAYTTHQGGTWYGFVPSLICNEKLSLKNHFLKKSLHVSPIKSVI